MNIKRILVGFLVLSALSPVSAKAEVQPTTKMSNQQENGIKVSGTVVDAEKNPLPGVTVSVKGTKIMTVTDIDGHFYLTVPDKSAVLVAGYVGFKTQEIKVANNINFNIARRCCRT